ncbi:MAG TPA: winged helix-turn-helix domain-containing protein [Amycolatopsis sp.]|uniref:winged helix-turn-helix domain-containing protein n=1 Tax=Amycolatopsis sp. TaxID=37632 RepID=UPI002B499963|nr:winged helix-turn-helix domain-containing protein [Amycolatopsis sp.]HKS48767.1 winged helix-turn-helix domain-containing protein [Amycolatopsis sp.]
MSARYQLDDSLGYVYKKMAEHLELRIDSGELQPQSPLPAERRLALEYGVSLGTARRATELLRERKLVVTLRSKGTFIVDRRKTTAQPVKANADNRGVTAESLDHRDVSDNS